MAKKKTRTKKRKQGHQRSADAPDDASSGEEGGGDGGATETQAADEGVDTEAAETDAADDNADAGKARRPKGSVGRKGRRQGAPVVDANIPSPDGENVSTTGGLYFVAVVLGLIIVAVVVQFVIGQ